jgi:hypothetical protein
MQQLVHEHATYAPIWQLSFLSGQSARVQESGLGLIAGPIPRPPKIFASDPAYWRSQGQNPAIAQAPDGGGSAMSELHGTRRVELALDTHRRATLGERTLDLHTDILWFSQNYCWTNILSGSG